MRTSGIKLEARERFAVNRYHAMLTYGVLYGLFINLAVAVTLTLALTVSLSHKWIMWALWAYGAILFLAFFLLLAPFGFGMTDFYLRTYRYEKVDAFHIFDGFNKFNLERVVVYHIIRTGLIILWSLLLIVPGIVYAIRTSMGMYLMRANPKMHAAQALRASAKIMRGHCGDYFKLSISFIGWFFLGIVTLGLGYIWVTPYYNSSKIVFYKRELQGDKKVYGRTADGTPYEDDAEDDDDDKNIALKLMKLQLEDEINDIDNRLRTAVTSPKSSPKSDKTDGLHITIPKTDDSPSFKYDESLQTIPQTQPLPPRETHVRNNGEISETSPPSSDMREVSEAGKDSLGQTLMPLTAERLRASVSDDEDSRADRAETEITDGTNVTGADEDKTRNAGAGNADEDKTHNAGAADNRLRGRAIDRKSRPEHESEPHKVEKTVAKRETALERLERLRTERAEANAAKEAEKAAEKNERLKIAAEKAATAKLERDKTAADAQKAADNVAKGERALERTPSDRAHEMISNRAHAPASAVKKTVTHELDEFAPERIEVEEVLDEE